MIWNREEDVECVQLQTYCPVLFFTYIFFNFKLEIMCRYVRRQFI